MGTAKACWKSVKGAENAAMRNIFLLTTFVKSFPSLFKLFLHPNEQKHRRRRASCRLSFIYIIYTVAAHSFWQNNINAGYDLPIKTEAVKLAASRSTASHSWGVEGGGERRSGCSQVSSVGPEALDGVGRHGVQQPPPGHNCSLSGDAWRAHNRRGGCSSL